MKKLVTICVILLLGVSGTAAGNATVSGTLSGTDPDSSLNNGVGGYDYDIDRTAANTFYWSAGSTVRITGTADTSGLAPGSFFEIGLIDKEQADMALDSFGVPVPVYMLNNSANLTFFSNNTARLIDRVRRYDLGIPGYVYDPIQSAPIANPGATPDLFSFILNIDQAGTMNVSLDGGSSWTSLSYGRRDWYDETDYSPINPGGWSGPELQNGSYLIAQLFVDTGTSSSLSVDYDVSGVSIPAPGAILLGGLGVSLVGWLRRKMMF